MSWGRVGEQDEGERRDMSRRYGINCQSTESWNFNVLSCSEYGIDNSIFPHSIWTVVSFHVMNGTHSQARETSTYLSNAFSFCISNPSSQPTSTNTLTPPSSSSKDCEAGEDDCAPRRGVKLNMSAVKAVAPKAPRSEPVLLQIQSHRKEGGEAISDTEESSMRR